VAERLLLVGMMGAGKSTVGRAVASRLGWPHRDTDAEIVRRAGATVPELFAARGEPAFRRLESEVLAAVLTEPGPCVVSVGGGAVLDPGNRAALGRAGTVVWLRARPATLAGRVGSGRGRPLLGGPDGAAGALARIEAERRAVYAEVATAVVDVDELDTAAVADRVLAVVESGAGAAPAGEAGRPGAGGEAP